MIAISLVAAVVDLECIWLLDRLNEPGVNIRPANTFSLNDFVSNGDIFLAGGLVRRLGSYRPDLVVGVAVAGIEAWEAIDILRDAHDEHHEAVHGDEK